MVKIASAQYPITYHRSFSDWRIHLQKWVNEAVENGAQILLFPEYGSLELVSTFELSVQSDLFQQVRVLDELKDQYCVAFEDLSREFGIIIIAPSIPVLREGTPVNRAYVFSGKGLVGYQDKLFMTRFENEEWGVASGDKALTLFKTEWGGFGIQTCYDVEFPLGTTLLSRAGANLIMVPSCTETIRGATRVHVGARARAMENQLYTVVSQTIGEAPWSPAVDINYGFSAAYSTPDKNLPEEGIFFTGVPQQPTWVYFEPDFSILKDVRGNGQVFNYRDMSRITLEFEEEIKVVSVDC